MSGQASTRWFYGRHGQEFGPFAAEQLHALAIAGRLRPTDVVWRDGLNDWVPAADVKGLFHLILTTGQLQRASRGPDAALPSHRRDPMAGSAGTTFPQQKPMKRPSKALRSTQNVLLVAVVLGSLLGYWYYSRGPEILGDFSEAVARSRETGEDVLFVFTAAWCGPCRRMKADLLQNKHLLEGRILCLIDLDSNRDLAREHEVRSIPAYGLWRNDQIVKKGTGYKSIDRLREWMDE